jgi:hypothetical protein
VGENDRYRPELNCGKETGWHRRTTRRLQLELDFRGFGANGVFPSIRDARKNAPTNHAGRLEPLRRFAGQMRRGVPILRFDPLLDWLRAAFDCQRR